MQISRDLILDFTVHIKSSSKSRKSYENIQSMLQSEL
jgi:hypothetical protein